MESVHTRTRVHAQSSQTLSLEPRVCSSWPVTDPSCEEWTTNGSREKRGRRDKFDLLDAVHASEYSHLKRPIDPSTKKPIEPAHKFEVTLESDAFKTEKFVGPCVSDLLNANYFQMGRLSALPNENSQRSKVSLEPSEFQALFVLRA